MKYSSKYNMKVTFNNQNVWGGSVPEVLVEGVLEVVGEALRP